MEETFRLSAVADLAQAWAERLEAEELRTLAEATGHHLPAEFAHRVARPRAERLVLASGELPPAAGAPTEPRVGLRDEELAHARYEQALELEAGQIVFLRTDAARSFERA